MADRINDQPTSLDRSNFQSTEYKCQCERGNKRESSEARTFPKRKNHMTHTRMKPYLRQFLEDHPPHDNDDNADDNWLLIQPHHRRQKCSSVWWKLFMWIGVTLILFGVMTIVGGNLIQPLHVLKESSDNPYILIDTKAQEENTILELCKVTGLILFCIGGITLAISLLVPSCTSYCDDHFEETSINRTLEQRDVDEKSKRLSETRFPASSSIKNVQSV